MPPGERAILSTLRGQVNSSRRPAMFRLPFGNNPGILRSETQAQSRISATVEHTIQPHQDRRAGSPR